MNNAMQMVTITERSGTYEVPGEPTAVKGVYLTPHRTSGEWDGWVLTHAPTGRRVVQGWTFKCPFDLRELAVDLAAICDDWTEFPADTQQWPEDVRGLLGDLIVAFTRRMWDEDGAW